MPRLMPWQSPNDPIFQKRLRKATRQGGRFSDKKLRDGLRKSLMANDPHCGRCRKPLQADNPDDAGNYACVVMAERKLACRICAEVMKKARRAAAE